MDLEKKVGQLEQLVVSLREQLFTDELTAILNRKGLMALLKPLVSEVTFQLKNPERRKNVIIRALSLVFIDIDHFKRMNDTYGHQAGDLVLKAVTNILRRGVREIDIVGRYGGEELIVGLVGAGLNDAKEIAEQLRVKIAETPIRFRDQVIKVTASFGVATLTPDLDLEELIKRADEALYRAKNSGRNKVVTA